MSQILGTTLYEEMMMSDDKVGAWVKKGQTHDDIILEWSQGKVNPHFKVKKDLSPGKSLLEA